MLNIAEITQFPLETNGGIDWNALYAIGSIGLFVVFVIILGIEIYTRLYRPYKEKLALNREKIYRPLVREIELLLDSVRKFERFPLDFWKNIEGKVSSEMYGKINELFDKRYNEFFAWVEVSKDYIRFKNYFYVEKHLKDLNQEFSGLGYGSLELVIYETILPHLLRGDKINLRGLEEKAPSFYENITKCSHFKDLRNLFEYLREDNPCIERMREVQKNLIEFAEKLIEELQQK